MYINNIRNSQQDSNADGITYGYIRVSTIAQHDDRQRIAMEEFGITADHIFAGKQSGKDFDRPAYNELMARLSPNDTLVVKSLDRLGRSYEEMIRQLDIITHENKLVTERAGANVASRSCASTSASCASEEIAANARLVRQTLCDTTELEQEKTSLGQELAVLVEMTQNCIAENARIAQDQGEYQKRYNGLVERYEKAKARFDEVTEAIAERSAKGERLRREASPFRGQGSSGRLRHRGSLWQSSMNGSGARWWTM